MQEKELKMAKAGNFAVFAAVNADYLNRMNACTYTSNERAKGQQLLDVIDLAYNYKESFINFRKTFIAVKIEYPRIKDAKLAKEVDAIIEERGYSKVVTPQGMIIRIMRKK